MCATTSKRWCPTPEQLMILEELYTRGLRTPNSTQIQKITAHLAVYGKIQGKNVFYWFQNHKARDRQKLRKKLAKQFYQQQLLQHHLMADIPHPHYTPLFLDIPHSIGLSAPAPLPFFHCFAPDNALDLPPPVTQICEESPEGITMRPQTWGPLSPPRASPASEKSYGHDSVMITELGPIFPCSIRNKPLETLQLFPLRSEQETGAS